MIRIQFLRARIAFTCNAALLGREFHPIAHAFLDALLFALQVRRAEADARAAGEPADDYAGIADDAFAAATERIEALPEALRVFHECADTVAG